jgi:hypothetical protein
MLLPHVSQAANWDQIEPQRTTESELVALFGVPDEVTATQSWKEWRSGRPRKPQSAHLLRYVSNDRPSPLLSGPGGTADSVEVEIGADGKVLLVTWHFGGPSARSATEVLKADPSFKFETEDACSHAWKMVNGYPLLVQIGPGSGTVEAVFQLK